MRSKYTIVTVAYGGDLGFMHLQARSIHRYVARDLIEEIIIIENGPPALPDGWRHKVKREYGALADLVRFVPASTIAKMPLVAGWFSQQLLKLMVAQIVKSKWYLLLDAKNHFVFPFTRAHIERDGKPRLFQHDFSNHTLRRYLDPILKYFDLPSETVKNMLPTTPPFVVDTALAREMIHAMSVREKRSFEDVFLKSSIRFTEFFTLSAYLLSTKRRFEDVYDLSGGGYPIIWPYAGGDDGAIEREIGRCETRKLPIFSVHRGAFPLLTDKSKTALAGFWFRRQLFPSESDALSYLADPNTLKG